MKLSDTAEEDLARSATGHDLETTLEPDAGLFPFLSAISRERLLKGIPQLEALVVNLTFAAEQFENALRLDLADDQYLIDLSGLDQICSETVGRFIDQRSRAIGIVGTFEARGQIYGVTDHRVG